MPQHGFGLGFRAILIDHFLPKPSTVDWVELISENFMSVGGLPRANLDRLAESYPLAFHGVGLSIASEHPIDPKYLKSWESLIRSYSPIHVTDHLCWTSHRNQYSHDLLPITYDAKTLQRVVSRVSMLQNLLGRRILLENPSAYLMSEHSTMTEAEFMARMVEQTECGVLLDVNNLVVNFYNLNQDPLEYIATLPAKCVGQIHLSGHSVLPNIRIDTHDHPMVEEGWELYALAQQRFPEADPLLEWDDKWPPFDVLTSELDKARTLSLSRSYAARALSNWQTRLNPPVSPPPRPTHLPPAHDFHESFWNLITGQNVAFEAAFDSGHFSSQQPVPLREALAVYQDGYLIRSEETMRTIFTTLTSAMSEESFRALVSYYVKNYPHVGFSMNTLGEHLARYLMENPDNLDFGSTPAALYADLASLDWLRHEVSLAPDCDLKSLADLQAIEAEQWESLRLSFAESYGVRALSYDVLPVWLALENKETPEKPEPLTHAVQSYRIGTKVFHEGCDVLILDSYEAFKSGKTFANVALQIASVYDLDQETSVMKVAQQVGWWLHHGAIADIATEPLTDSTFDPLGACGGKTTQDNTL